MTRTGAHPAERTGAGVPAGPESVRRLLADVTADPKSALVVGVSGPGGVGKTEVLTALSGIYRRAGLRVHHSCGAARFASVPRDADAALVDAAHELTEPQLAELVEHRPPRLVIAYRPWPPAPALAELAWTRPEVRLGHLDKPAIAGKMAAALGSAPPDRDVDRVWAQTGGLPGLVDRLLDGRPGSPPLAPDPVRAELDRVSGPVRELLLALALGAEARAPALAAILSLGAEDVVDALECAWSTGLLDSRIRVVGLAADALLRLAPATHVLDLKRRIAEVQLDQGGPLLRTGQLLLDIEARGPQAAAALAAAGDEALNESAELAARLFEGAVAAGAPPAQLAARRAEAVALTGDLDGALWLADQALADTAAADRGRAASVVASVLAQRGMLAGSAVLHRRTDSAEYVPSGFAVTALIGVGELAEAEQELGRLDAANARTPTLLDTAQSLVAHGVHQTIIGDPVAGLSKLVQANTLLGSRGRPLLMPDSPTALAALVAIHLGELDLAGTMLAKMAGQSGQVGSSRGRLLRGWIALLRGEQATVRTLLADLPDRLEPRDELFAAALAIGLARRRTDLTALMRAWPRARDAVLGYPVDLYVLQPLGEIAVAAARLHEGDWLLSQLNQAEAMLLRLGRPALWSAALHWYGLHAAIAADSPSTAVRHVGVLTELAGAGRYPAALAKAGRSWLRVLANEVAVEDVLDAARALPAVGLAWDGARLAGQAAIRTPDRRAMAALLNYARAVQGDTADAAPTPEAGSAAPAEPGVAALSNREREVAALLVEGMTYKQIGERLFISAKTVEHHIARVRHRLGSPTRRDLLARLKMILTTS